VSILTEIRSTELVYRSIYQVDDFGSSNYLLHYGLPQFMPFPDFLIVGWESLPLWLPLLRKVGFLNIIFDELHKAKAFTRWQQIPTTSDDPEAKEISTGVFVRYERLENIVNAAEVLSRQACRRLGTTATPIQDRPRDLWSQLDLIEPKSWGTFKRFANRYCAAYQGSYGYITEGSSNADELSQRLKLIRHRVSREETHGQLPAKRRRVVFIQPSDLDQKAIQGMEPKNKTGLGLLEFRLEQACAMKRKFTITRIAERLSQNAKIVVFTARHADCEAIFAALQTREELKGIKIWMAHGGHGVSVRDDIREEYMAHPGPCVLVGTGMAWGEGVNLHDTDEAFFVMLPITPGQVVQWEGRFSRKGQLREVIKIGRAHV
jgi:hypothetical protein